MYEKNGERYFIVDGHIHFWDGSPENQANKYGKGFIECFYDYHRNLSPPEWVWPLDKFEKYTEQDLMTDVFDDGYVDVGIFSRPTSRTSTQRGSTPPRTTEPSPRSIPASSW